MLKKIVQATIVFFMGVAMFCDLKYNIIPGKQVQMEPDEGYKSLLKYIHSDNAETENVDFSKPGKYEFEYRKQWNRYKGIVKISDTTPPEIKIKNPIILEKDFVSVRDFEVYINDWSEVQVSITGIEKISENISKNEFDMLNTSYITGIEKKASLMTDIPVENGLYEITLQAVDSYGNTSEATTYAYRDKEPPVFSENRVIRATIKDNHTVSVNMGDVEVTDAFCGQISTNNISIINTSNFPQITIKAIDSYGNESKAEYTVNIN